ncbi:MAG: neutral/alkaline non-lysosomal ceramidase N-terminal domain-containing protein [Myxococcota bacterium]
MTLLAGAARADITPEPGIELMGYGLRSEPSRGVHDPLFARALYLAPAEEPGSAQLLVSADLCLLTPLQARELRQRIGAESGLPWTQILLACTHTHSGPETGLGAEARGRPAPPGIEKTFAGIVRAALEAPRRARPARVAWARARCAIGRNRRLRDGPEDSMFRVLRVEAVDGSPLALILHCACHPTVLGHENLEISADWPGVACRLLESETGSVALFMLGAHADVDPRTRGLKDLAIPGQSVGLGFEAVEVLGRELAESALGALAEAPVAWREGPLRVAGGTARVPLRPVTDPGETAESVLARQRRELAERLEIHEERLPSPGKLEAAVRARMRGRPLGEAREAIAQARAHVRDHSVSLFVGERQELDVELQLMRIADTVLLGLPLEMTVAVGRDWQRRASNRELNGGVISIANGWLRYLPHASDLAHPEAHLHYEVLASLLAPPACERLLEVGERLLARL